MSFIVVIDRQGVEHKISASSGISVMENIRSAGIDELLALCGGCCSCATCHVYVDQEFGGVVGSPSEDEDALLDSSENRTSASRLSCQIVFSDEMSGLQLTIAPED